VAEICVKDISNILGREIVLHTVGIFACLREEGASWVLGHSLRSMSLSECRRVGCVQVWTFKDEVKKEVAIVVERSRVGGEVRGEVV